jgi:predicted RNase H-like nuclease (RuvC/YqgF family)
LRENQQSLQQLQRQVASRQVDQRNAKQELDRIKANKAYLEKELAAINARVDGYQEIIDKERVNGVNTTRLQTELVQLSRTRDSMKRELDAAYALSSSIKVEG